MKLFIFASLLFMNLAWAEMSAPNHSLQLLVVPVANLTDTKAKLYTYERANRQAPWTVVFDPIEVSLGRTGIALGLGFKDVNTTSSYAQKIEGDGKSPAGIFKLSKVFGYAKVSPTTKMPYIQATKNLHCVDDSSSKLYNQIITKQSGYGSHEKMLRKDNLYKWGVVVDHNAKNIPLKGSCIFLHITSGRPTAGCTAMKEKELLKIIKWLDAKKEPVLVQYLSEQ